MKNPNDLHPGDIEHLAQHGLPARAVQALWDRGYRKVGELAGLTEADAQYIPGFGEASYAKLRDALAQYHDLQTREYARED